MELKTARAVYRILRLLQDVSLSELQQYEDCVRNMALEYKDRGDHEYYEATNALIRVTGLILSTSAMITPDDPVIRIADDICSDVAGNK